MLTHVCPFHGVGRRSPKRNIKYKRCGAFGGPFSAAATGIVVCHGEHSHGDSWKHGGRLLTILKAKSSSITLKGTLGSF